MSKSQVSRFVLEHRDGSRKSKVHAMFDDPSKGPDVAKKWAIKNGIKHTTVNSWFSQFRKQSAVLAAQAKRDARKALKDASVAPVAPIAFDAPIEPGVA